MPLPAVQLELTCQPLGYSSHLRERKGGEEGREVKEGRRRGKEEEEAIKKEGRACVHVCIVCIVCIVCGERRNGGWYKQVTYGLIPNPIISEWNRHNSSPLNNKYVPSDCVTTINVPSPAQKIEGVSRVAHTRNASFSLTT